MKTSTYYEVWAGDDLVDDSLSFDQAVLLARESLTKEPDVEVVVDEVIHYTLKNLDDLSELENL